MGNFKLVGGDTNTSSNHILQLIDANYSGAEPVDDQKRKSWLFKAIEKFLYTRIKS